ncbi:MAG: cytochrome c3 family protein [Coriobacteriia bacterium]|nr:cytochrome c3 family protein [Coriobacteriia bacterium]
MKKAALVLAIALIAVMASAGVAYANFGPHGGYEQDTDACAGCHRAHTSFSELGWVSSIDGSIHASALLVSNASTMTEFCYACHGDAAPGASTNVQSGVFDGGPTGPSPGLPGDPVTFYQSNSTALGPLNGGGFDAFEGTSTIQSSHIMDAQTDPVLANVLIKWGNADLSPMSKFTCTDCHDPHGSSNYRLLKDNLDGDKTNWVESFEEGFPVGGFVRGPMGAGQIADYVPNYTAPYYKAGSQTTNASMSGWCAGCHTSYNESDGWGGDPGATYDYSANGNPFTTGSWTAGPQVFHRHPMGVTLAQGQGPDRALNVEVLYDDGLPMELTAAPANYSSATPWTTESQMGCLTCHRAHGTLSDMSGWAVSRLDANAYPVMIPAGGAEENAGHGSPIVGNEQGTNPGFSESLLRYPNRGVCERCHDK